MLRPLAQEPWNYVTVAVRSERAELMVQSMGQAIAALDPNLAVQQLDTVDQAIAGAFGSFSMIKTVLICFAGLGLFLAALGLYGVIARLVAQRTPEIGIRMALGAQRRDVTWLILGSGLRLICYGAAIGIVGSIGLYFILSRWSQAPSINVPAVFAVITAILLLVGLVACWLPARRATKIDPHRRRCARSDAYGELKWKVEVEVHHPVLGSHLTLNFNLKLFLRRFRAFSLSPSP